ncbi:MAG: glycoside hydrolase family 25 protein, partial [Candidatus Thiodiazotropha sp.]
MEDKSAAANEPLNAIIDLSHHNQVSDFSAIRAAGILGVIHKATQGTGYTDPAYADRRTAALDAGLLWGAYHFADASDATEQADHFLSTVDPTASDLLVLDMEQNYSEGQPAPSMSIAGAETFTQRIERQTGRFPGLYSGSYIKELLGDEKNPLLANCWFWLAQYGQT